MVEIKEFVTLVDAEGKEHEGYLLIGDLAAIQTADAVVYGKVLKGLRLETKITCDAGDKCANSSVNDDFKTVPKILQFTEDGSERQDFVKDLAKVVVTSDYNGAKKVFCCTECAAEHLRREHRNRNTVEISAGKGSKTQV